MAEEEKEDVQEESSTSSESTESQVEGTEDDKEQNFSQLRKKHSEELSERDERIAELESQVEKPEERVLSEAKEEDGKDASKTLFEHDLKKATRKWNRDHKVSASEWKQIQDKVSLVGNEDDDLIYERVTDAYESLPAVKEAKKKELIEQGKKEGIAEFTDSEMDIGGGGEVVEGSEKGVKLSQKDEKFLDDFGVTKEERKQIK